MIAKRISRHPRCHVIAVLSSLRRGWPYPRLPRLPRLTPEFLTLSLRSTQLEPSVRLLTGRLLPHSCDLAPGPQNLIRMEMTETVYIPAFPNGETVQLAVIASYGRKFNCSLNCKNSQLRMT